MLISQRTKGFTIVELLIVIVVIAILAAITTVAYSGLTARAEATRVVSEANVWKKAFQIYKATNGSALDTGGVVVCLGDNLPATDDFPANACQTVNGGATASTSPATMSALQTVVSNLPSQQNATVINDYTSVGWGIWKYRGIWYNGTGGNSYLGYYISGNKDCGGFTKSYVSAYNYTLCTSGAF